MFVGWVTSAGRSAFGVGSVFRKRPILRSCPDVGPCSQFRPGGTQPTSAVDTLSRIRQTHSTNRNTWEKAPSTVKEDLVRRRLPAMTMIIVLTVLGISATAGAYSTSKTYNSCTATHSAGAAYGVWYASTTSSDADCEYVDVTNYDLGGDSDSTYTFYANVNDNSRPDHERVEHAQCGPSSCSVPYAYFINWP